MVDAPHVPDTPPANPPKGFTIRLYGKLLNRLLAFSGKKDIRPTTCAKLLLGEKLDQEGF